ncbi:MAG: zinc finger Ran-binding domain-containing protein [Ruminococcus sp.]|nr:zinc finger Ran-binding domain-containing protein [Ruminococcus sp.]
MECPVCRTSNTSGAKYCIRCGRSLENSPELNYGQLERDNYNIEEYDFGGQQETGSFEEYDFSGQPETNSFEEYDFGGQTENITSDSADLNDEEILTYKPYSEYANNSMPLPAPAYNDMYRPQVIGYDQNGIPIYSQPSVYMQPQIIGYDQNGVPIYVQPQFIGYDQNGIPVYMQSQFIGYDQNGMPVYAQSSVYSASPQSVPVFSQSVPVQTPQNDEAKEKFMDFLDDGKGNNTENTEENFFEKSSDMGSVEVPVLEVGGLKKRENQKTVYMADVEIKKEAENLIPNNANKFNQKYMRQVRQTSSDDLGEKKNSGKKVSMGETQNVNAEKLNPKFAYKSRIKMGDASHASSDDLKSSFSRRKKVTMAEADHAVEAMPKKKKYVDELDLIELPEYMQARKKVKKDENDFPSMTDL